MATTSSGAPFLASFARTGAFPAQEICDRIFSSHQDQSLIRTGPKKSPSGTRSSDGDHVIGCPISRVFCEKWDFSWSRNLCSNLFLPPGPIVDTHRPDFPIRVSAETAPHPFFWGWNQAALYGILMHVVQLLRLFALAPHIKIIETALPEVMLGVGTRRISCELPHFSR